MAPRGLLVCLLTVVVGCGGTGVGPYVDGSVGDGAVEDVYTTLARCAPGCGSTEYCLHDSGYPGYCPPPSMDAGCIPGCPGCPKPTETRKCQPLPTKCAGAPSCACLLQALCSGCGPSAGECGLRDGEWQVSCYSC